MIAKVNVVRHCGMGKASTLYNVRSTMSRAICSKTTKFIRTKKPGCAECSVGYRQNGP